MSSNIDKKTRRGVGQCGNPFCSEPRAEDRYVCESHAQELDSIRADFEADPKLLYRQRSDNPNRVISDASGRKYSQKIPPMCCKVGCFEIRVPPAVFCSEHENERMDD